MLTPQEAHGAVRDPADAAARGHLDHLHQPQAEARCSRSPTASPCCAAARRSRRCRAKGATEESLARAMVGREVLLRVEKPPAAAGRRAARGRGPPRATTTAASRRCAACPSRCAPGEIVGIAGVDGNGQTELIEALTGLRRGRERPDRRRRPASSITLRRAHTLDAGLGHIPEDRQRRGLVLEFSHRREHRPARLRGTAGLEVGLALPRQAGRARNAADQGVRRPRRRPVTRAGALSGGNQQKLVARGRSPATRRR